MLSSKSFVYRQVSVFEFGVDLVDHRQQPAFGVDLATDQLVEPN